MICTERPEKLKVGASGTVSVETEGAAVVVSGFTVIWAEAGRPPTDIDWAGTLSATLGGGGTGVGVGGTGVAVGTRVAVGTGVAVAPGGGVGEGLGVTAGPGVGVGGTAVGVAGTGVGATRRRSTSTLVPVDQLYAIVVGGATGSGVGVGGTTGVGVVGGGVTPGRGVGEGDGTGVAVGMGVGGAGVAVGIAGGGGGVGTGVGGGAGVGVGDGTGVDVDSGMVPIVWPAGLAVLPADTTWATETETRKRTIARPRPTVLFVTLRLRCITHSLLSRNRLLPALGGRLQRKTKAYSSLSAHADSSQYSAFFSPWSRCLCWLRTCETGRG
ncbi:MAG: hypothetical protein HY688_02490 [Chloroflexi bacterium]|nr:hypothetical protein [Chloroflexota bacterium]